MTTVAESTIPTDDTDGESLLVYDRRCIRLLEAIYLIIHRLRLAAERASSAEE